MSSRSDKDLLSDIQAVAQRIAAYTAGMTYDAFPGDTKTQDAVVRNLEIIGEATKNLSVELRAKYPDLPWKGMVGVRDRLIHDYFGVNLDIVWQIITAELPEVVVKVEVIKRDNK